MSGGDATGEHHPFVRAPLATPALLLDNTESSEDALTDAASRRLSNQIGRAYRGTYGASEGLRTVVESVTRQMLRAGSSPAVVSRVLARCVLMHPANLVPVPPSTRGVLDSRMLIELTERCVAEVALELPPA